jgi:hypothetical protein
MQLLCTFRPRTPDLADWEKRLVLARVEQGPAAGDYHDAHERIVATEGAGPPEPDGVHRQLAQAILRFNVFPPRLVTPILRRAPLQVRDTVGIRYHLFPGLDLFFAARVVAVFDEQADGTWRTGFTYRTLEGHPEAGEETFSVEKDLATGQVLVALRSWSRPALLLTRAAAPLARRWQLHAGRAALDHLEGIARRAARLRADLLGPAAGR